MATKTPTKKAGRPERSKLSYRNEIQRLKATVNAQEETIKELVGITDHQYKRLYAYQFPSVKQRIKYLIKGE